MNNPANCFESCMPQASHLLLLLLSTCFWWHKCHLSHSRMVCGLTGSAGLLVGNWYGLKNKRGCSGTTQKKKKCLQLRRGRLGYKCQISDLKPVVFFYFKNHPYILLELIFFCCQMIMWLQTHTFQLHNQSVINSWKTFACFYIPPTAA